MQMIWNLARITIAFGLTLLGTDGGKAQSVPLNPNVSVIVPPTSVGVEPDLAPTQSKNLFAPFKIMNGAAVECEGVLQQMTVRSLLNNRYNFYYRIRTTSGNGAISRFNYYSVGGLTINVAYRKDLRAGSYSLTRAGRNPWGLVTFMFYQPLSCAYGDTPYFLMKSYSSLPLGKGSTQITTTTGNTALVLTRGP
jgi:hypothetical protein